MSTVKERLRAVEVELHNLRSEMKELKETCNKQFDVIFSRLEKVTTMLSNINPQARLSGKDKAAIVCSCIVAVASIIVAWLK